jgi:hypothetical protein
MSLSSFLIILLDGILAFLIIRDVCPLSGLIIVHAPRRERCAARSPRASGNPDSLRRERCTLSPTGFGAPCFTGAMRWRYGTGPHHVAQGTHVQLFDLINMP